MPLKSERFHREVRKKAPDSLFQPQPCLLLQTTQLHLLDALTGDGARFWSAKSRQEGTTLLKG